MWMIELTTNTATADTRMGSHSADNAVIWGLLLVSGEAYKSLPQRFQQELPRAVVALTVDEERRRPVHAAADAAREILAHARLEPTLRERRGGPLPINAQLLGVADEVSILERVLVLEQQIVQRPELAVLRRRLGQLGSVLRVLVHARQRKMAVDEAQIRSHAALDPFHDGVRRAAVRALEIAILDQRDRRVRRTLDVVARADG